MKTRDRNIYIKREILSSHSDGKAKIRHRLDRLQKEMKKIQVEERKMD